MNNELLIADGNRSVGESWVKTKAKVNKTIFNMLRDWLKNQIATPDIAIINVGDSAL